MTARRPPTLVVLGGGPAQRHAIDAARRLGVRTVVCDSDPRLGDVEVSSEDTDGVRRVAREADGLIAPGTDWPVRIAAYVAEDLGLSHPISSATARLATNKLAQRELFTAQGIPQPAWSADAPPAYPCVVKAPDRQGQRAMSIIHAVEGLEAAVATARSGSRSGRVLFEALVPGPEVTVNGFSTGGEFVAVTVTDRIHFEGVPGVAHRHVFPTLAGADEAASIAARAVSALGIDEGPSYVQLILADDGPKVIEVAARLGGGHDSELCLATVGVDLAEAAVEAALGRRVARVAVTPHPRCAGVIEFLHAPAGELVSASGSAAVHFYHPRGHVYAPLRVATDRAGYVLCTANTREEALEAARTATAEVTFQVT